MPKLSEVSLAWERLSNDELREVFPGLACFMLGWGEPFCFRCGWLSPTPEAADYPRDWKDARAINAAWDAAAGWLERAHLHDHRFGGDESPLNLVPLCPLCHERQPMSRTREDGIAFVNEGTDLPSSMAGLVNLLTDQHYRNRRNPGKQGALRSLLRERAAVGEEVARAAVVPPDVA